MKHYRMFFYQIIDKRNVEDAMRNAAYGKREHNEVQKCFENYYDTIHTAIDIMIDGTYLQTFTDHKTKIIIDGSSRKERKITIPSFIEQIIHHSVMNILAPKIQSSLYEYSCGSVPGRGPLCAKSYIEKFIKNNKGKAKYYLKLDIHKFFASINHEILKIVVANNIKDRDTLRLIFNIIDCYSDGISHIYITDKIAGLLQNAYRLAGIEPTNKIIPNTYLQTNHGIPIGFYTSQWFANWFLNELDHIIKEKFNIPCYVRYMDDMVLFSSNKKTLENVYDFIILYLKNINLELKEIVNINRFHYYDKSGKSRGKPLNYVGYLFYRDRTSLRTHILKKSRIKAIKIYKKGTLYTWYDSSQMLSYVSYFKHSDNSNFYKIRIKPYINIKMLKSKVSNYNKMKGDIQWD